MKVLGIGRETGKAKRGSGEEIVTQRLQAVQSLLERFTYDLALLIAGWLDKVTLDYCDPADAAHLLHDAHDFLETGSAFRPNFGNLGQVRIEADFADPTKDIFAYVSFVFQSLLETGMSDWLRGEPYMRFLYLHIDPTATRILKFELPETPMTQAEWQTWVASHHAQAMPATPAPEAPTTSPSSPGVLASTEVSAQSAPAATPAPTSPEAPIYWQTQRCAEPGCHGVRAGEADRCLAHLVGPALDLELQRLRERRVLDLRGVRISDELWQRVRQALADSGAPLESMWLDQATFEGDANLAALQITGTTSARGATFGQSLRCDQARFNGALDFTSITVQGDAFFSGAEFAGATTFGGATFGQSLRCDQARFNGALDFTSITVQGQASFLRATFASSARFFRAAFASSAWFTQAQFEGPSAFNGATFSGGATFGGARFKDEALFESMEFSAPPSSLFAWLFGVANFVNSSFEGRCVLGPMLVRRRMVLDNASFRGQVTAAISAGELSCVKATFLSVATVRVRWAEIALDNATFAEPSILSGSATFGVEDATLLTPDSIAYVPRMAEQPRLVSVRQANVGNLALSSLDLRACRFVNAHNLDELRLEANILFADIPPGLLRTHRRVLAEEHEWRWRRQHPRQHLLDEVLAPYMASPTESMDKKWKDNTGRWKDDSGRGRGWFRSECRPPVWLLDLDTERPNPDAIAPIYRALRKGREDNKDEPGAADFYIGEMEMRRHAEAGMRGRGGGSRGLPGVTERFVLWFYWLLSGYGYDPGRALAWIAGVITVFAVLFWAVGLPGSPTADGQRIAESFIVSIESATSLVSGGTHQVLTLPGEAFALVLRILSAILVGLTIIALRARIRR